METTEGSKPPEHGDFTVKSQPSGDTSLIDRFPYVSRLGTNDVPSDDETEEIKTFLREPTEQVQQMEAEISSLQARLDFLRTKHAALKNQIATCRSLITIPRRLPEDILLEIFSRCLPETSNPTMDSTTAPLLLTAICRRWRILALQTPTLWSTMVISIKDITKSRSMGKQKVNALREALQQHLCSMLSMWLERSGTCPLTFSLYNNAYGGDSHSIIYGRTLYANHLQILLPFISRWKNVLLARKTVFLTLVMTVPPSEFLSLESLFLDFHGDSLPEFVPMFDAPRLRKVSIQNTIFDPATLTLPWARLTHLDLGRAFGSTALSITQLSTLLGLCASLMYLGLDMYIYHGEIIKPMFLPNLRKICLRQPAPLHSKVLELFSENLNAPLLRKISLRNFDRDSLTVFLSKQGQSIRSLDFDIQYIDLPAFAEAFRHCPSLESLTLIRLRLNRNGNNLNTNKEFFSLFTPSDRSDTGPLCPLLQELIFDNVPCNTLTGLASFIEAKQNPDTPDLSRLVRISTDVIREGEKGVYLSEETVKQALKPFMDTKLLFEMWQGRRPYSYGMSQDQYFGHGPDFQYADCWKD